MFLNFESANLNLRNDLFGYLFKESFLTSVYYTSESHCINFHKIVLNYKTDAERQTKDCDYVSYYIHLYHYVKVVH